MSERNTPSGPATGREAAIKILMGDIAPLFHRASDLQDQLAQLQGTQQEILSEFKSDMQNFGVIVSVITQEARTLKAAGVNVADSLQRLEQVACRIEAGAQPRGMPSQRTASPRWLVPALAALLCTALLTAGFLFWQQRENRNALAAGHATLKAWPQLSDGARKAIEAASAR